MRASRSVAAALLAVVASVAAPAAALPAAWDGAWRGTDLDASEMHLVIAGPKAELLDLGGSICKADPGDPYEPQRATLVEAWLRATSETTFDTAGGILCLEGPKAGRVVGAVVNQWWYEPGTDLLYTDNGPHLPPLCWYRTSASPCDA